MAEYPICPRCDKPVRQKNDRHELLLQLVNADPHAPKKHTMMHEVFHHACAAEVWNVASAAWHGSNQESERR